jgi:hypothetical protein
MAMNFKWTWACVLGCAGMAGLVSAMAAEDTVPTDTNPYSVISDRNVFHLNPPPPPPTTDATPPPEQRKVILTGLIKKHNSERDAVEVFMAIPPKDAKDSMIYLTLAPGEKGHDVELVRVRFDKEEVDIVNAGIPETLSVKSNSYASITPPAAHVAGGAPAMPGLPGFGHRGGFPGRNALPTPGGGGPAAAVTPGGGSAIIAGGGGSSGSAIVAGGGGTAATSYNPNAYAGSSRGTLVSGGSPYVPPGNVGEQVAGSLFNQQTGRYQPANPTAPPAPGPIQAAAMAVQGAVGGPPAPPIPGGE